MKLANSYFTILILLSITFNSFSQDKTHNMWYFGEYAGIDFNSGEAVAISDGALDTQEGCASICDSTGALLFYSDGITVWNSIHQPMSSSLPGSQGGALQGDPSSTQSATILPLPGSDSLYYIFTVDNNIGPNGLCYSIIDMSLDSGLGDIISYAKNIELLSISTEKLTYVKHANNRDYWIITHPWNSATYHAYLLTPNGIDTNVVISYVGTLISGASSSSRGYLKSSPDGNYICAAIEGNDRFEIYTFNKLTGALNTFLMTAPNFSDAYGVEFSPDSKKLYGTSRWGTTIYQWDLSSGVGANVYNSVIEIGNLTYGYGGALQLAPDGKIYVAKDNNSLLAVINNPNGLGLDCNLDISGFSLGVFSNHHCHEGLPNYVQSTPISNSFHSCFNDTAFFSLPNSQYLDSAQWNFNFPGNDPYFMTSSTQSEQWFVYPDYGNYSIQVITSYQSIYDTIYFDIFITELPVLDFGPDTVLCPNEILYLDLSYYDAFSLNGQCDYLWNIDAGILEYTTTIPDHSVSFPSTIIATVSGDSICGSVSDTLVVEYSEGVIIDFILDTIVIWENEIAILNPQVQGFSYLWSTGETTSTIEVEDEGYYYVSVTDEYGCVGEDSVCVIYHVGIESFNDELVFSLYPNPATDNLNIQFGNSMVDEIKVFSSIGTLLFDSKINSDYLIINISEYEEGIYFIKSIDKNRKIVVKPFTVVR